MRAARDVEQRKRRRPPAFAPVNLLAGLSVLMFKMFFIRAQDEEQQKRQPKNENNKHGKKRHCLRQPGNSHTVREHQRPAFQHADALVEVCVGASNPIYEQSVRQSDASGAEKNEQE